MFNIKYYWLYKSYISLIYKYIKCLHIYIYMNYTERHTHATESSEMKRKRF